MIAALIALILSMFALTGTDAGLITEPAPAWNAIDEGFICYEYEQADAEGTGCEPIPGYEAEAEAAAEGRDAPELPLEAYAAYETCAAVDAMLVDDEALAWMLEAGWAGVAGDGSEALYAPGCVATA